MEDTDSAEAAGSNIPPNIVLGTGSIGFVEGLVRVQAEAAADVNGQVTEGYSGRRDVT